MKKLIRIAPLLAVLITSLSASAQIINMAAPETQPSLTGWKVTGEHVLTPASGGNGIGIEITKVTGTGSDTCSSSSGCKYIAKFTTNAELLLYAVARESSVAGEDTGSSLAARERRRQTRLLNLVLTNCATLTVDPCPAQISSGTLNPNG
jgi:hypothetical protein